MLVVRTAAMLALSAATSETAAQQSYTIYDNGELALIARTNPGVQEPSIPIYLNGVRVNDPSTGGMDSFDLIDFFDRVPGTSSFPLSMADIVANGFIRPLVQRTDGTTSAIGTSIVTGPSFRPQFEPLDLIPDMVRADVTTGGSERVRVLGTGQYGGRATFVCERAYPDPIVGQTVVDIEYTWTASQAITLPSAANGRGNDAFRFIMFSSMLASTPLGQYDARYIAVTDPLGRRRTLEVSDEIRNGYLFPMPRPIAAGRSFALLKDNAATWNPGSPSIEVQIISIAGAPGPIGVQGYRADTTDPNDDSLSVWLEWIDAPATIAAGTTIVARFRVIATPATDPGDVNHDGRRDCADVALMDTQIGRTPIDALFSAYADLDRDGVVTEADRALLRQSLDVVTSDYNDSGATDSQDFFDFLNDFFIGTADFNNSGATDSQDLFDYVSAFFLGC